MRHFSFFDKVILELDKAMQTRASAKQLSLRPTPQPDGADNTDDKINDEQ